MYLLFQLIHEHIMVMSASATNICSEALLSAQFFHFYAYNATNCTN